MLRIWVMVALAGMAAQLANAAGTCSGDACSAVAANADSCTVANTGDKSIKLITVADQVSLMMTVLAPGEVIRQDKTLCAKFARGEAQYDARYADLRTMPDAPDFTLKNTKTTAAAAVPKQKPVAASPAPAAPAVPAPAVPAPAVPAPVVVASTDPAAPRFKPAPPPVYPPLPRAKPAAPAVAAAAPEPAVAPPAVAAIAPAQPVPAAPAQPIDPASCGEACATILFKVVDECLWVVNLNPRPVAFEAQADGKRFSLLLEAADGNKADARATAVAKGQAPRGETSLHMRLHDPFESTGIGIPIYRARIGGAGACIKERTNVASFSARFVN